MERKNVISDHRDGGWIRRAGRLAAGLLYPPRCPLCDGLLPVGGGRICKKCEGELPWITQPFCMKCGKMIDSPEKEFCSDCLTHPHDFTQGIAAFQYSGKMRASIQRMKFSNRREYLDFYAECMVGSARKWLRLWRPQQIMPVPMHWIEKNRRGFNQSELLAEKIGKLTGIPVSARVLTKRRNTREQKTLSYQERRVNLRHAFAVKGDLPGLRSVLIIDDVYTTGSTMDEISRTLKRAGADHVFFLVICTGKGKKMVCTDENV